MKPKQLIVVIFLTLILAGCVIKSLDVSSPTPTVQMVLQTPSLNAPTATQTGLIIIPTADWTPIPTLSLDDVAKRLTFLYANNGDCVIPCWWGITPGETTWLEANQILGPLGFIHSFLPQDPTRLPVQVYIFRSYWNNAPKEIKSDGNIGASIIVQNNVVRAIAPSNIKPEMDASLAGALTEFGRPDEIWVKPQTQIISLGPPLYHIFLLYSEKGYIRLYGEERFEDDALKRGNAIKGDVIEICPQYIEPPYFRSFVLWSAQNRITFQEGYAGIQWLFFEPFDSKIVYRLNNLSSNITEEELYDIYRDPKVTECIRIAVP